MLSALLLVARFPQLDKVGRKPFLLWGSAGVTCSLAVLSISFVAGLPGLAFAASAGLVAAYALSFGPVTWLITAEMFPAGIRGKALGIGQVRRELLLLVFSFSMYSGLSFLVTCMNTSSPRVLGAKGVLFNVFDTA